MVKRAAALALVCSIVIACGEPAATTQPIGGPPVVVLTTYLEALVRGDCSAGKALGTCSFTFGNGELCGSTTVSRYTILGDPSMPNPQEAVFATTLVTSGFDGGLVAPGSMTWFYTLRLQEDGSWRLTGGGSGP